MRAVVSRVTAASVVVEGEVVGQITEPGLLVLLGVTHDDGPDQVATMARKLTELRILRDERSVLDVGAPVLLVSQFTLYGDVRKGRRPSWSAAAPGPVGAWTWSCSRASWTSTRPVWCIPRTGLPRTT